MKHYNIIVIIIFSFNKLKKNKDNLEVNLRLYNLNLIKKLIKRILKEKIVLQIENYKELSHIYH